MGEGSERGGGAATGGRLYANDLAVEFSLAEFTLDFSQRYGTETVHVQSRLITSPSNMVDFQRAIDTALGAYERRYGAILRRDGEGGE